jgi:hypothetical protein
MQVAAEGDAAPSKWIMLENVLHGMELPASMDLKVRPVRSWVPGLDPKLRFEPLAKAPRLKSNRLAQRREFDSRLCARFLRLTAECERGVWAACFADRADEAGEASSRVVVLSTRIHCYLTCME